MKIAVVTDDGTTICQHFGRAQYYSVITIENGKVKGKEQSWSPRCWSSTCLSSFAWGKARI